MFWPTSFRRELTLPELSIPIESNGDKTYELNPHLDPILKTLSSPVINAPYAVITYRSLYILHSKHHTVLNVHLRSNESIAEFGSNEALDISPNGKFILIKTSSNYILIYNILPNGTDKELLSVYSAKGELTQNGYPLTNYHLDSTGYWGTNNEMNNSLINGILTTFVGESNDNLPNLNVNLRLRFILNCAVTIKDLKFIDNETILTIQDQPHGFHYVKFINQNSQNYELNDSEASPVYVSAEKMEWFSDKQINNNSSIVKMEYNYDLDTFIWINENGDALIVKKDTGINLNFVAKSIYKANGSFKAIESKINFNKSLCLVVLENGETLMYKLSYDVSLDLLKVIKKPINSSQIKDIKLSLDGCSFIILFENGWNVYSFLGNLNFSSYDYDNFDLIKSNQVNFTSHYSLLLSNDEKIIEISLSFLNYGLQVQANTIKRPILISEDKISVFKVYEKKLVDHHHYNYNINDITDKDTNIWLTEALPLKFKLNNPIIRSCAISDDGQNICVVGNYNVIHFNVNDSIWKQLDVGDQNEDTFEKIETPIRQCLWFKNYLILASKTQDNKESEVIIFSNNIVQRNMKFDFSSIIWAFNFKSTTFEENLIGLNIDLFNDELIVMTDQFNCYTWNLILENERLIVQKSIVYQLKSAFPYEALVSMVTNFCSVVRINESQLLLLTKTELYYIQRKNQKYQSTLINKSVEYVMKLNSTSFVLFTGSQMLKYNLNNEKDVLKSKPIIISIGNSIEFKEDHEIIKSTGTRSYPITVIWFKNIIFGLEIDLNTKDRQMTIDTVKINYLHDLVDHYIKMNIGVINNENDKNALSIIGVYNEFQKAKNFKFVLERLLVDYIQLCYEDKNYDVKNEYFDKLNDLINITRSPYEIILNCLKKSEIQYWSIYFDKASTTPRDIVNDLFENQKNYHLSAHFLIIMMNYEQIDKQNSKLSNRDIKLASKILFMLIINEDFETSFALMRFIKVIDEKTAAKLLEKLKYKITIA